VKADKNADRRDEPSVGLHFQWRRPKEKNVQFRIRSHLEVLHDRSYLQLHIL
jgi:hypothetical protein